MASGLQKTPADSAKMPAHSPAPRAGKEVTTPQGTVSVLLGYTVVIIALWSYMYISMLLMR